MCEADTQPTPRCESHPAYDFDYCPICTPQILIGNRS